MMRTLAVFLLLISISEKSIAQFAIVKDNDGFLFVRNGPNISNNVIDTLKNGEVVWYFEKEGNWFEIEYEKKGIKRSGYAYSNRLIPLENYPAINKKSFQKNIIIFKNDSVEIKIKTKSFKANEHKLIFDSSQQIKSLVKIDNKTFYGTDGEIPKEQYKSISINYGSKTYNFDTSILDNLFNPNLNSTHCYIDKVNNSILISAMNSDGAGGYGIIWVIKNGEHISRRLFKGF
jgi:uncharacterized protein YgiM (DUF1202 family)